ncbi:putative hydrolase YxeP [Streptomyces netropsis]|uniref:Hippurate hydrolase n=1 Tax=Streptomyces syringium TaxID=76729 RepID=A0ABS4YDY3_9ACTN|nr:amidohydrolase [Streptomyces syringium]MBP2406730.1 hippurate hydrolase [Streptomyces syringium]SPE61789.1 putative hydrolase YxeP [Streptomyces netropsis]
MSDETTRVLAGLDEARRRELAGLYRDLHSHPELSFAEHHTAAEVARRSRAYGFEMTEGVGRTGVVAVLRGGAGPTVLLRADFDALPVEERTGLPYASTSGGVMHACGHDMHTTCLLGAMRLLAEGREHWSGTVLAVFQPAEETGQGARAMVDDGLFTRFGKPDVVLGQHVIRLPAGTVGCHPGTAYAATDVLRVRMFGADGPDAGPGRPAGATATRLQTVLEREMSDAGTVRITADDAPPAVGGDERGDGVPVTARLKVSLRTCSAPMRQRALAALERAVREEAAAAGAAREPEITALGAFPSLVNDVDAVDRTMTAIGAVIGADKVVDPGLLPGGEDIGVFGTAADVPVCFWQFGGTDPDTYAEAEAAGTTHDVPANHSPFFAPVIEPTLTTGVTAMVAGALAWLGPGGGRR